MLMPQDWEGVAHERQILWEKEIRYRTLLAQFPSRPSFWRQWTGGGLVRVGTMLMHWGERMAQCECRQEVSVTS
jgi:hypothetical protein